MLQLPSLYRGVHRVSDELARLTGDLQKFLLRDYDLVVDEKFGPQTESVLKQYQGAEGIAQDGRVGPQTWGKLLADGFCPQDFVPDAAGFEAHRSPRWPPKPQGIFVNGELLFGRDFSYTPRPLPTMPEYVEADPEWVRSNIGKANISQLVGVTGAPSDGSIFFNRRIIPQLEAVFGVWEERGDLGLLLSFAGSWVTRFIRGRRDKLSNHAFGSAFDINAAWNGYRRQPALVGSRGSVRTLVMPAFELGFYWGGWYNDGMHFEAYKILEGDALKQAIDRAREWKT